ncbi:MAG: serine dehydratase subunit alpha family protein [Aeromonas sp.]
MTAQWKELIALLKREVVPALGCTEPIAVALAAAHSRELLGQEPERMAVRVSGNLFKNGVGVGVPGTGQVGLVVAAAVGAIGGNARGGLEVLAGLTPAQVTAANALQHQITLDVADDVDPLYAEVLAYHGADCARVVIAGEHTRVVQRRLNDQPIDEPVASALQAKGELAAEMDIGQLFAFASQAPLEELAFMRAAAELNGQLSQEGLRGYGLHIGHTLTQQVAQHLLGDDLLTYATRLAAAASDARMDGAMLAAMSNSGSGNQGIAATVPVLAAAERLGSSAEACLRALVLSHLVAIYAKRLQPKLSALCAASTAAMGSAAAISWLLGGGLAHIHHAIQYMVADVSGMICDGAGTGCALKVSTATGAAVKAALLAQNLTHLRVNEGVLGADADASLRHLGHLCCAGMQQTDQAIIALMRDKQRSNESVGE